MTVRTGDYGWRQGLWGLLLLALIVCAGCETPGGSAKKPLAPMLLGKQNWDTWLEKTGWPPYTDEAVAFMHPKLNTLARLQQEKRPEFLIFGGSWCPDTEAQLPRIMKILEASAVPPDRIQIYGVDYRRREFTGTARTYRIDKIPTVVVLVNGKEAGRIVEFPRKTWEDDFIDILSR